MRQVVEPVHYGSLWSEGSKRARNYSRSPSYSTNQSLVTSSAPSNKFLKLPPDPLLLDGLFILLTFLESVRNGEDDVGVTTFSRLLQ